MVLKMLKWCGVEMWFLLLFQLSKLAESGSDRLECANVDLKADIERWHQNKITDFRELLTEYSERHANYYKEVRV